MTIIEGILLGIFQGLTEFLPVSSSGHLCLLQQLFGIENPMDYVLFDLVLHLGTLLSIIVIFSRRIMMILLRERVYIIYLAIGVCGIVPFYFTVPFLKTFYSQPRYIGFFFIVTSLLLYLGERCHVSDGKITRGPLSRAWRCAAVGASQIVAVLPGVSRSGITVSLGRMLGWKPGEAAEYSFLLVIPVILAGTVYEFLALPAEVGSGVPKVSAIVYLIGFMCSFLIGIAALKMFLTLLERGKFIYFSVYCAVLGVFCLIYFNLVR